jgi:hypothetical protein
MVQRTIRDKDLQVHPRHLQRTHGLQLDDYYLRILFFSSEYLYIAGFLITYSSLMKLNSVGIALTIHGIPTFGPRMIFTGLLKAASIIASQYKFGVT